MENKTALEGQFTIDLLEEWAKAPNKINFDQFWCSECYKPVSKEEQHFIMGFAFCEEHYLKMKKELEKDGKI